jgi:hypothetical protein
MKRFTGWHMVEIHDGKVAGGGQALLGKDANVSLCSRFWIMVNDLKGNCRDSEGIAA